MGRRTGAVICDQCSRDSTDLALQAALRAPPSLCPRQTIQSFYRNKFDRSETSILRNQADTGVFCHSSLFLFCLLRSLVLEPEAIHAAVGDGSCYSAAESHGFSEEGPVSMLSVYQTLLV